MMSRAASAKVTKSRPAIKSTSRRSSVHGGDGDHEMPISATKLKPRPKTAWKKSELERVRAATKVLSKEERAKLWEIEEAEKRKLELESQSRKRSLQELDAIRDEIMGKNGDPFAEERAEQATKLLDRALLAKHEQVRNSNQTNSLMWNSPFFDLHLQEDEVKRANKIILAAKVHVLQNAQINEKKALEKQWREKDMHFEKMMLERDAQYVVEQKKKDQEVKDIRDKYANDLKDSLRNRETKKLIEAERIENEAKVLAMAQEILKREQEAKEREKQQRKIQLRTDFQTTLTSYEAFKKRQEEQKREAEMKAQEFMRQKAEQEKELEKERRLQRERKQKEIDRILERQKELLQNKEDSETTNLRRIQEQKEREFRKQALEAASKKKEMEKQVLLTRAAQLEEQKRIRAEIEKQKTFERQRELDKIREVEEKEKADKEKVHQLKRKYRAGKKKLRKKKRFLSVIICINECN